MISLEITKMSNSFTRDLSSMDDGTFGNSKACKVFSEMMRDQNDGVSVQAKHKLIYWMQKFILRIKRISECNLPSSDKKFYFSIVRERYYSHIDDLEVTEKHKSYAKNILRSIKYYNEILKAK